MFKGAHSKGRKYLYASLIVFAIFVFDIVLAKIQVLFGVVLPLHLGATLQFLVLLLAVALFVMATLAEEAEENDAKGPN